MFDPSKLDLDLQHNQDKKKQASKPSINESTKIAESKKTVETEKTKPASTDDLDALLDDQKSPIVTQSEEKQTDNLASLNDKQPPQPVDQNLEKQTHTVANSEDKKPEDIPLKEKIEEDEEEKSYGSGNEVEYDKKAIIEQEKQAEKEQKQEEEKIIFDINIKSIQDIFHKLIDQKYDFVTVEPLETHTVLHFRKDKVIKESLNIKFPVYTQILVKTKTITQLAVDVLDKDQEGSGKIVIKNQTYKVISKTVPGGYGEKIFLKVQELKEKIKKEKKSVSFGQILGFLGAALFSVLLIGVGFLTFVLLNATSVQELSFFQSVGVDVGAVRDFTSSLVNGVFTVILVIETLFLFTFTFKALLTKKIERKKKISRTIFSIFFLIITFITATLWMTLSNKINSLKGQNYGKVLVYDNEKILSPIFDKNGSLIDTNKSIIGPFTARIDISEVLKQAAEEQGFKSSSVTWINGDEETKKPVNDPEMIMTFDKVGLHEVKIIIDGTNINNESEQKELTVAKFNIDNVVGVTEKTITGGGIYYQLDANSIKDLGKIEWYMIDGFQGLSIGEQQAEIKKDLSNPANKGYLFDTKYLFDEEIILAMKILQGDEQKDDFDKIFVFSAENASTTINATITEKVSLTDDFKYTFQAKDIETILGNGHVSEFVWRIEEKTIRRAANLSALEESSQIQHKFTKYGNYKILLDIIDTRGNIETIEKDVIIKKKIEFSRGIEILQNNQEIENIEYNRKLHEYILNDIAVPSEIMLNANNVRSRDSQYRMKSVEWDFQGDKDIDSKDKKTTYLADIEGRHHIIAHFTFAHLKRPDDIITVEEHIYIDGIKKEAQLSFDIKKDSSYVPIIVGFDASKSQVKNENIVKFEWDYGDGTKPEIRDAIVPGHKYSLPGDYEVKLTVTTESGKRFTHKKTLVLKPKPQNIEITTSMKSAPTYQGIDFLSDKSEGQITSYFWDFGDGNTSTQANPTHYYTKPGEYEVKLRLDFANNNVLTEKIKITIFEE